MPTMNGNAQSPNHTVKGVGTYTPPPEPQEDDADNGDESEEQ